MLEAWLERAVGTVWNYPVVGLCLLSGLFFTLRMAFIQFRALPHAVALVTGKYDHDNEPGELTHFQALSAALSGTVGLGNIAGVAIAIGMGGPGAVFWMWLVAFLGMATKYVECALGTIYRKRDEKTGKMQGGAMYYITAGLGSNWWPMAMFFSVCLMMGSFGAANMFQANQVAMAMAKYGSVPHWVTGLVLASLVAVTIIGGIRRIGQVTSKIVPAMCLLYLFGAVLVCVINIDKVPAAFSIIFRDAFSGAAAAGGAIGTVIIIGVRRAIFSNESGMGSAPIAHAAVKTDYPIREGVVATLGPLIDTLIVCTATALVIIIAGKFGTEMYESAYNASFRKGSPEVILSGGWDMVTDGVPADADKLRSFRDGQTALAYSGSDDGYAISPPIAVLPEKEVPVARRAHRKESHVLDGIRFSSYHGEGAVFVDLLDSQSSTIASFPVDSIGKSIATQNSKGKDTPFLSITPSVTKNAWTSHVITFAPAFKKAVAKANGSMDQLRLRFRTEGPATWYVDRFQAVRKLEGVALTSAAFDSYVEGLGSFMLTICISLFCYSTMISWSYYGETAARYVFGHRGVFAYKILFVLAAYYGAVWSLTPVLNFSDLMIGLMVIPNALGMFSLMHVVIRETKEYFARLQSGAFEPSLAVDDG